MKDKPEPSKRSRWLCKRRAIVFPLWIVRDYMQYHKWVKTQLRFMSLKDLKTVDIVEVWSDHDDYGHVASMFQVSSPSEINCASSSHGWEPCTGKNEVWLSERNVSGCQTQIRFSSQDNSNQDRAFLFRFCFTKKQWISTRTYDNLFTPLNTSYYFKKIAKIQVCTLTKKYWLPSVIAKMIVAFAIDDVIEAVSEELDEDED
jgi:hypothetical protein